MLTHKNFVEYVIYSAVVTCCSYNIHLIPTETATLDTHLWDFLCCVWFHPCGGLLTAALPRNICSLSLSTAEQWLLLVPRIQTFINRNMRDVPVLLSTHLGHGTQTIVVHSVHLHLWCMSQIDHNMHITTLSPLTPSADANHYCKLQFSYSQQTPSQSQSECTELQDGWCVLSARCVVLAGAGQCLMITICLSPLLVCSRLTWQPGHCTGHPPVLLI